MRVGPRWRRLSCYLKPISWTISERRLARSAYKDYYFYTKLRVIDFTFPRTRILTSWPPPPAGRERSPGHGSAKVSGTAAFCDVSYWRNAIPSPRPIPRYSPLILLL